MKIVKQSLLYSCVLFFLSGCGFHLAGQTPLPPSLDNVYVKYEANNANIGQKLARALKTDKITILTEPAEADYILKILYTNESNALQGAGNIQETRRYLLTSTVAYIISDAKGQSAFGPITVSSNSSLYIYSGQVIGSNQETVSAYRSLDQQNIQKILLTLSSKNAYAAFEAKTLSNEADKKITKKVPAKTTHQQHEN
jgi:LPS-assembly lipoprotein